MIKDLKGTTIFVKSVMVVLLVLFIGSSYFLYEQHEIVRYYGEIEKIENMAKEFSRESKTGEVTDYKLDINGSPIPASEKKYLLWPVGKQGNALLYDGKTGVIKIWDGQI